MSFVGLLLLVPLAVFGLMSATLCIAVSVGWACVWHRWRWSAVNLLALRCTPVAAALLVSFLMVVPAFVIYEPRRDFERAGLAILLCAQTRALDGHLLSIHHPVASFFAQRCARRAPCCSCRSRPGAALPPPSPSSSTPTRLRA